LKSTKSWPIKLVDVIGLSLDTENVRLQGVSPYEEDILRYIFEYEKALVLAQEIVADGFFDNDLPIVVQENQKYVVLEGNRRVSALKGIANPTSVKRFRKQLEQLRHGISDEDLEDLQTIYVKVAPSRQAAQAILASLHTRNPKKPWPPLQQAEFYYAQIRQGMTIAELQERYPSVAKKIPRFISMAEMHSLLGRAVGENPVLNDYIQSDKFSISTFERLYRNAEFQDIAGIKLGEDGLLKTHGEKTERDRILARVAQDMKEKRLDTRLVNKQQSAEFIGYVAKLTEPPTDHSHGDYGNAQLQQQPVGQSTESSQTKLQPKPDHAPNGSSSSLDFSRIDYSRAVPGLKRRYIELQKINYRTFPNATIDLLRSVLECTLKQHFEEIRDPVLPQRDGGIVALTDALKHAESHFKSNKKVHQVVIKLITKPQDARQNATSAEILNTANHNAAVFTTPQEVRDAWDHVTPLLEALLAGLPKQSRDDSN